MTRDHHPALAPPPAGARPLPDAQPPVATAPPASGLCAECGSRPARYRARLADVCSRSCFDKLWRRDFLAPLRSGKPPVVDRVRMSIAEAIRAAPATPSQPPASTTAPATQPGA